MSIATVLLFGAACFFFGAAVAYLLLHASRSLADSATSPRVGSANRRDVVSMRSWQQGMAALGQADERAVYLWDLFRVPEGER